VARWILRLLGGGCKTVGLNFRPPQTHHQSIEETKIIGEGDVIDGGEDHEPHEIIIIHINFLF